MPWCTEWGNGWDQVDELTHEQEFLLARIAIEATQMSKQELIAALVGAMACKFSMRQTCEELLADCGVQVRMQEVIPVDLTSEEALRDVFGYSPSDEEAQDYVESAIEEATMELDMDAIVLTPED